MQEHPSLWCLASPFSSMDQNNLCDIEWKLQLLSIMTKHRKKQLLSSIGARHQMDLSIFISALMVRKG